jgi:beta-mannosidase
MDPQIEVSRHGTRDNLVFTLSAIAVAPWTWIDHPSGTVGHFVDTLTGMPSNG